MILFSVNIRAQVDDSFKKNFGYKLSGFCYGREIKNKFGRIGKIIDVDARCQGLTIFSCFMKVKIAWENGESDWVAITEKNNPLIFIEDPWWVKKEKEENYQPTIADLKLGASSKFDC